MNSVLYSFPDGSETGSEHGRKKAGKSNAKIRPKLTAA